MPPTGNGECCTDGDAPAGENLFEQLYAAEQTRAHQLERKLQAIVERCGHFEADVARFIRENATQREQIQELRTALRAMAYLVTEAQVKAQSQALAR